MGRRSERWQLRGVLLAAFAVLGLAGLGRARRACAAAAGMASGYGSAYLVA